MEREIILGFPEEIIEEILSRVPVKSLLKFRCVSKSWRYLIGSERFIKTHLETSSKDLSHHRIFLNHYPNSSRLPQHCSLQSLFNQLVINSVPFMDLEFIGWKSVKIVGCCNGLVCILVDYVILYLWNPSTRSYKNLHYDKEMWDKNLVMYGLGYDESSNGYKVVCNFYHRTRVGNYDLGRVYSRKTNSWKGLMSDWDWDWDFLSYDDEQGKFVNGNLHWIRTNSLKWDIISFDLKSEVYKFVDLPRFSKGTFDKTLGVIEGCLSLVCDYPQTQMDVWVMKESWEKVATLVNIYDGPWEGKFLRPVAWGPNGEILLFYGCGIRLYNSKDDRNPRRIKWNSRDSKCDGAPRRNNIKSIYEMDVYVESLVSSASNVV